MGKGRGTLEQEKVFSKIFCDLVMLSSGIRTLDEGFPSACNSKLTTFTPSSLTLSLN